MRSVWEIIKYILGINWRDFLLATLTIVIFFGFLTFNTNILYARDLTDKERIMNKNNTGIVLYDRHGRPFFSFDQGRDEKYTPLSEIPIDAQKAVIAAEDQHFFYHKGFDLKAILRSAIANFETREIRYGGSTITQQLVKNSLLNPQKSFLRKYQEVVLAYQLENNFSKNEILEMYLNSAYFGEGAFGIQEAAQRYFSKDVKDLTLAESTILIGILPSPSQLSPISGDFKKAKERQSYVLTKMAEQGYITQEQKKQAEQEKLQFNYQSNGLNQIGAHFALMVRDELIRRYGEDAVSRSGFKVYTSLDLDWQQYAEETVKKYISGLKNRNVQNGSVVVIDPKTGEVLVLVGSYDWYDRNIGKVNAALIPRQPGSAFKPIVYLTALEKGTITPATILHDQPTGFRLEKNNPRSKVYAPKNFDGGFRGPMLPRRALANSLNVPAVEVMDKTGVSSVVEMSKRLGITSIQDYKDFYLSMALGSEEISPLEIAGAYATLANYGKKNPPTLITKIVDKNDRVVYQYQPPQEQVVDARHAFQISSILSDDETKREVFGSLLKINRPAAVKTGTTNDYKDAWTVGYLPSLVVAVWIGNNDHTSMANVFGSIGAAPLWKELIEYYSKDTPIQNFEPPSGMVAVTICKSNGLLLKNGNLGDMGYTEYFVKGTEPTQECNLPQPSPTPSTSPAPLHSQDQNSPSQGNPSEPIIIIENQNREIIENRANLHLNDNNPDLSVLGNRNFHED